MNIYHFLLSFLCYFPISSPRSLPSIQREVKFFLTTIDLKFILFNFLGGGDLGNWEFLLGNKDKVGYITSFPFISSLSSIQTQGNW